MMKSRFWPVGLASIVLVLTFCIADAAETAANVTGTWTVSVSAGSRNVSQTLVLTQDGEKVSGTFQGPRQSGSLEGTVTGNTINFHVKARVPLDYTGTVDGDSMKGTMTGRGQNGDWTATRAK